MARPLTQRPRAFDVRRNTDLLSSWLPTYLHEELGVPTTQLSLTALPFLINAAAGIGFGFFADRIIAHSRTSLLTVRRSATVCHAL